MDRELIEFYKKDYKIRTKRDFLNDIKTFIGIPSANKPDLQVLYNLVIEYIQNDQKKCFAYIASMYYSSNYIGRIMNREGSSIRHACLSFKRNASLNEYKSVDLIIEKLEDNEKMSEMQEKLRKGLLLEVPTKKINKKVSLRKQTEFFQEQRGY